MDNNYKELSDLLHSLLELDREVVGIKLFSNKNEFESNLFKEEKHKKAYCTIVRDASKGKSEKISGLNFACKGSARALGMIPSDLNDLSGIRRKDYKGFSNLSLSRSVSRKTVHCLNVNYGVAVGPLNKFINNPDIVIIITNSFNIMRILHGYSYNYGNHDGFEAIGLGAICQEVTSIPFELNKINISFLCPGTRLLCQWGEGEIAIGIPFNYLAGVIEGILQTVNPFERDGNKKRIEEKLKKLKISNKYEIKYKNNYDDGGYRGLSEEEKNIFLNTKI